MRTEVYEVVVPYASKEDRAEALVQGVNRWRQDAGEEVGDLIARQGSHEGLPAWYITGSAVR